MNKVLMKWLLLLCISSSVFSSNFVIALPLSNALQSIYCVLSQIDKTADSADIQVKNATLYNEVYSLHSPGLATPVTYFADNSSQVFASFHPLLATYSYVKKSEKRTRSKISLKIINQFQQLLQLKYHRQQRVFISINTPEYNYHLTNNTSLLRQKATTTKT